MRLEELARKMGGRIEGDPEVEITGIAPIDEAGPGDLTFVANPRYRRLLLTTKAAAVIVGPREPACATTLLRTEQPYLTFVRVLRLFDARPVYRAGVHPTAVIAESARIGPGAFIAAYVVIDEDVSIGAQARIHAHVTIYPQVRIGDRFTAHAGAVVRECVTIGDDVTLQPGAVLGGDGFGFMPRGTDSPLAIPQIGTVHVADHVDVGANTTIDRAAVGATRIGKGVKLDNLVMIAHGCRVGEATMLAAQVGVAGSSTLGARVMAGGQAGVAGHIHVGDDVAMAAQSAVLHDIEAGQRVAGTPAVDIKLWRRYALQLVKLPGALRRLSRLEALLERVTGQRPESK